MIRVLLVDDEELARDRMRQLLGEFDDLEVVGQAENGEEAIEKIVKIKPDLVFLDIQMPECSGLEVAASLPDPRPRIVFCTAYDQYAIDAFELHAVDYLLKPVTRARLQQTLERVGQEEAVSQAFQEISKDTPPRRLLGKRGNRFRVIPVEKTLYFSTEDGLTRLHTEKQYYWMEPPLNELERRLGEGEFFRVSRQALVNLDSVREVRPLVGGYGEVVLRDGTRLDVSRRRMKELMARLKGA